MVISSCALVFQEIYLWPIIVNTEGRAPQLILVCMEGLDSGWHAEDTLIDTSYVWHSAPHLRWA